MNTKELITEIKKKKELSRLPDSIVKRALEEVDTSLDQKSIIKEARSQLRKYFGVFLTNKVLKPKDIEDFEAVLKSHKSSEHRDYVDFYHEIKSYAKDFASVVDIGCAVNGFSYRTLANTFTNVDYVGIEASGQVVDVVNKYFDAKKYFAKVIWGDAFDLEFVEDTFESTKKPIICFMFQVIDALEAAQKDFSKELLTLIKKHAKYIAISNSLKSISGKKKFESKREWLTTFLQDNFEVLGDSVVGNERLFVLKC